MFSAGIMMLGKLLIVFVDESAVLCQPGGPPMSWGTSGRTLLARSEGDYPALLYGGVGSPQVPGAVLGTTILERH